jgi:hypothetical protein
MGYSDSLATVENRRDLLGNLMEGEPEVWSCEPGTEKTIAYQIRECLYIGEKNPKIYPKLAQAQREFNIIVQGPGSVAARPKKVTSATPVGVSTPTMTTRKEKAAEVEGKELAYGGAQTANSIVQHWISSTGAQILHFPEAELAIEDLKKLHKWAQEQKVLLFFKDPMMTLRPYDPELAAFSFDPDEDLP